ncbi:vWA domain-containing protein [Acetobacter sp.]|uniref:vWA domain-containing protein n=1 Tax=Acetobacter sp. TaxID=440 RepID=UPI0039E7514D
MENSGSDASAIAQSTANATVQANAAVSGINPLPNVTATYIPTTAYSGSVQVTLSQKQNFLMSGFLPTSSGNVSVSSTASMTEGNAYIQVIFLVDISNSMGVGGTPAAITELENGPGRCAFACHDPKGYYTISNGCILSSTGSYSGWGKWQPPCDMRTVAKANGISLKIDYVNQSLNSFLTELSEYSQDNRNHLYVGIDTFGTNITQVLSPTTDMTTAENTAASLDIENSTPYANANNNPQRAPFDYSQYNGGYTKTSLALQQVIQQLDNVGDGSSASSRKTYVIFISDGAEDVYSSRATYKSVVDVSYVSYCTQLKNQNVKLFSIWVPYYPFPGNQLYDALFSNLPTTGSGSMEGAMETCASGPGYYLRADDGPAIQTAFASALGTIIQDSALRLSH